MNLAAFRVQFPEFVSASDVLVNAFLAASALEIDAEIWGAKYDQGHGYLTAHKLALSPFGNAARMVIKNVSDTPHGQTTFGTHYDTLVMQVGFTGLVV